MTQYIHNILIENKNLKQKNKKLLEIVVFLVILVLILIKILIKLYVIQKSGLEK